MRKNGRYVRAGGFLLSVALLAAGEMGSAVAWAAQPGPETIGEMAEVLTGPEKERGAAAEPAGQGDSGAVSVSGGDFADYPVSVSENTSWADTVSGSNALRTGVVWSGNLSDSAPVSNGSVAKWWKNGIAPVNFQDAWIPGVPQDGKFQLSVENADGETMVHCQSQDVGARYSMMNKNVSGLDYSKKYILSAYVKAQDVTGTGFYLRAQGGENVGTVIKEGVRIKGTTDGWQLYELVLENITSVLPDNSGKMKIEVFFEKFTGDIWVKDIVLREDYTLEMDRKVARMNVGETLPMAVSSSDSSVDLTQLVWESSNSEIALVENGTVTAVKGGNCVVTASMPDGHFADCTVLVSDPLMEADYIKMREKWTDRLTGNSYWNGGETSQEYMAIVEGYDTKADEILSEFVDNSDTELFSTLDLVLKEGSLSINSNDSVDLSEAIVKIQYLARAYACKGSKYYKDDVLKDKILYAFDWVHSHIYHEELNNRARYGNWFHWWISMPQNLAGAAILMYDELSEPENQYLLEDINATLANFNEDPGQIYQVKGANGSVLKMTGANLADTCLASVLRSILASKQDGIVQMVGYFPAMVKVTSSGEGIYPDGSFIQHVNVPYTGGYGATLINGTEKLIYLTDSTGWEIPVRQTFVLFDWILKGIRPLYAQGAMFDMVSGRSVARPGRSDYSTGKGILAGVVLLAKSAPDELKSEIESFAKTQLKAGAGVLGEEEYYKTMNPSAMMEALRIVGDPLIPEDSQVPFAKIFGGMDKAVAHSESFSAGFSLASARTRRFEFGNDENSRGWHQSDGMLYLYNGDTGQFSDNYWNTVDPQRLPGITTDHSIWDLTAWGNYAGNANYNGGAALGRYAAVAMNFKNYAAATNKNLTAKKTWFIFDDEILCMGAGITGIHKDMDTETIVENKKVNGDNALVINGEEVSATNNLSSLKEKVTWAWLEGNTDKDTTGYYFPGGSDVFVKREERTGSFRDINNGNPLVDSTPAVRNYVSLSLKHGEYADGKLDNFKYEDYGYVLLPGKTKGEVEEYSRNPDIEILANNAYVQAAHDKVADVFSFCFWQPSASSEKALRVEDVESDYASIVMERNQTDKTLSLGIADPLQNRDKVTVRLYGNNLSLVSKDENISVVKTDKYGVVLEVATKGTLGATFQAVFTYEEQSAEVMEEYAALRKTYTDSLTGNEFPDKSDAEYRTVVDGYTHLAKEAWDTMVKTPGRTTLWQDLDVTLDYINKGTNNNDSAAFETTTFRINNMALAYGSSGSSLYQNRQLGDDIISAMAFVLETYPSELADKVYGNWWHWDIGVARDLCDITLLMYDRLDDNMIHSLYQYLDKAVPFASHCWMRGKTRPYLYTTTAANTMDISVIRALTGIIGNDPKGLYMASDELPAMMKYVTVGDGFYSDGSYVQHGTLAYTGGYGADAIRGVARITALTNGTPWECKEVDNDIVYEWILNGFRPLFADGASFEMVAGRQISRYRRNDITTARYIMDAVLQLAGTAPEMYRDKILSFAKTQLAAGVEFDKDAYYSKLSIPALTMAKQLLSDPSIPVDKEQYTKIYSQMDKAAVHGDGFALGISMYSSRRANTESGNSENFKGWYTADGMTYLYNGDQKQYNDNFWPTVDMTRLAGITTNHVTGDLGSFSAHVSPNSWVGGSVANDRHASVGMDFSAQFSDLKAKKSWFVLGDQIVALGAGITSTEGDYTETIVENRKIDNQNQLATDAQPYIRNGGEKLTQEISWAWLSENLQGEAIGYYFPGKAQVSVLQEERTGKWQDINTSSSLVDAESAKEIIRSYLTLAVEHGTAPAGETYSYVLLPGRTKEEMAEYALSNTVEILANTETLQAVRDSKQQIAGYNFWTAGNYVPEAGSSAIGVQAQQPASITISEEKGSFTIGVSDPTQKANEVTVILDLNGKELIVADRDDRVAVEITSQGKAALTVDTSESFGMTCSVVIRNKETQEAYELLELVEEAFTAGFYSSDKSRAEELMRKLEALDTERLSQEARQRWEAYKRQLRSVITDINAVNDILLRLEGVSGVNKDNVEEVRTALDDYGRLDDARKALLTQAQRDTAESVKAMLQTYEDSLIPGEGGDGHPGEDENPEEGENPGGNGDSDQDIGKDTGGEQEAPSAGSMRKSPATFDSSMTLYSSSPETSGTVPESGPKTQPGQGNREQERLSWQITLGLMCAIGGLAAALLSFLQFCRTKKGRNK